MNHLKPSSLCYVLMCVFVALFLNVRGAGASAGQVVLPAACSWNVIPSPDPNTYDNSLWGVTASSPSKIWAVGYTQNDNNYVTTLIIHWNGTSWDVIGSPNPDNAQNLLLSVTNVPGSNELWAVGDHGDTYPPANTMILQWNGIQWQVIPSPNVPGADQLLAVAAISKTDAWAVGVTEPSNTLPNQTLIEHWDGTQWSIVQSPNQGSSQLQSVTAITSNDVWAVGSSFEPTTINKQGIQRPLIEHWDGTQWSIAQNPAIENSALSGVAAASANDIWAVGFQSNGSQALTEHWDGTNWQIVPNPGTGALNAVEVGRTNDVWAVGTNLAVNPLTEHWNGTQWRVIPNSGAGYLFSVAAVGKSNQVWAVGVNDVGTSTMRYC